MRTLATLIALFLAGCTYQPAATSEPKPTPRVMHDSQTPEYLAGYDDGRRDGFEQGRAWANGRTIPTAVVGVSVVTLIALVLLVRYRRLARYLQGIGKLGALSLDNEAIEGAESWAGMSATLEARRHLGKRAT